MGCCLHSARRRRARRYRGHRGLFPESRRQRLRSFLDRVVDIDGVARFCLGRFWHQATLAQQQEHSLVAPWRADECFYSAAWAIMNMARCGSPAERPETRDGAVHVSTVVERTGAPPVQVTWAVSPEADNPRILDVIAEGVSLRPIRGAAELQRPFDTAWRQSRRIDRRLRGAGHATAVLQLLAPAPHEQHIGERRAFPTWYLRQKNRINERLDQPGDWQGGDMPAGMRGQLASAFETQGRAAHAKIRVERSTGHAVEPHVPLPAAAPGSAPRVRAGRERRPAAPRSSFGTSWPRQSRSSALNARPRAARSPAPNVCLGNRGPARIAPALPPVTPQQAGRGHSRYPQLRRTPAGGQSQNVSVHWVAAQLGRHVGAREAPAVAVALCHTLERRGEMRRRLGRI